MKRLMMACAVSLALMGIGSAQDRPAQRQKNQQQRIREGVRSGELTKKEAAKIQKREARLHREIRRDRVDGGGLTPRERVKIEKKQDQLSRVIARQKHDAQQR